MCSCGKNVPGTLPLGGKDSAPQPNVIVLKSLTPFAYDSPGNVFVQPINCQSGHIWKKPGKTFSANTLAAAIQEGQADRYGAYLNCKDRWWLLNDSASDVTCIVIPLCCEIPRQMIQPEVQAFADGWQGSLVGENFVGANPTIGTVIDGQTAFSSTTPTILLGNAGTESTNVNLCLRSIQLSQDGTVAGGVITVVAVLDSVYRWSAAGTALSVKNKNSKSSAATGLTKAVHGATATAAAATARTIGVWSAPAAPGTILDLQFEDSIHMGETGSILIYTWNATTKPQWGVTLNWREYRG